MPRNSRAVLLLMLIMHAPLRQGMLRQNLFNLFLTMLIEFVLSATCRLGHSNKPNELMLMLLLTSMRLQGNAGKGHEVETLLLDSKRGVILASMLNSTGISMMQPGM